MVSVRQDQPLNYDGSVNLDLWIERLLQERPTLDKGRLLEVCEQSWRAEQQAIAADNVILSPGNSSFRTGLDMADILVDLGLDEESLVAAVIYRAVREGQLTLAWVEEEQGAAVAGLVDGVLRMAVISGLSTREETVLAQEQDQLEQVRNLMVSLIDDVRVALIKIAERTCALRAAVDLAPEKRRRLAEEVFKVHAPLAHRLGIGQLKWELEDLSFSHLRPDAYKRIAGLLDEKRGSREEYVKNMVGVLEEALARLGVAAEVQGRAKHIYSIWRKMQSKNLPFSEVHDVHAMRILVPEQSACYSVLGVVHNLWRHLPDEFDDYIARPKENGYRSLHTAVAGPEGKVLEVQIRTHAMHEDAEFGVCSHWRYKSGKKAAEAASVYEDKINWLRQVVEWQEEMGNAAGAGSALLDNLGQDRIYVFTPEGHVVDMTPGSTPLDFAYRVHTDVGHCCRAARVNGRITPLNRPLQTGDRVEILVGGSAEPRREWLHEHLGYLKTSRARAKVQNWFRLQSKETLANEGRRLIREQFAYMAEKTPELGELAPLFKLGGAEELCIAVGKGDLKPSELVLAWQDSKTREDAALAPATEDAREMTSRIAGADGMQLSPGECCNPAPDGGIIGMVGEGDHVVVHRQDCAELWRNDAPGKRIELNWRSEEVSTFPVNLRVDAFDRAGLLMDVAAVVMNEKLNMTSVRTRDGSGSRVSIEFGLDAPGFGTVLRILERIEMVPNVIQARKLHADSGGATGEES